MNTLSGTITSILGKNIRFSETQNPPACIVPPEKFLEAARTMKKADAFLSAEWATDETLYGRGFGVFACYRRGHEYLIVKTGAGPEMPRFQSLTKKFVPAYRFERQIASLMGVIPTDHPDLRPWIKFEDWPVDAWPLRKSFDAATRLPRTAGEYEWVKVEGEGVYEIGVGPVHAGIIEPGHFRFQAVGEQILNLEERLGYVHKGIEKRFEALSWDKGARLAGRVSGDSTVAHCLAYCRALENMTGNRPPERALWLRALLLERERIANHIGDIGAICNDVAFALMLYQCSRLKETMLRNNLKFFGHRFMMDMVVPGGVKFDVNQQIIKDIFSELDWLSDEFERLAVIYDESSSLEDRVREAGVLTLEKAREFCTVGFVARASGINLDCRINNPFPPYDSIKVNVPVLSSGDVHARAWIRIEEVRESIRIIREILSGLPEAEGSLSAPVSHPAAENYGFAAVEGWRGEIIYWLQAGPEGRINRCMVRDPSALNWLALEQAIHGNIVPDFPLCNKSFNQSYSGHDL